MAGVGGLRQADSERRNGEERDPGDEHAAPAEDVAGAGAEQEQPAEGERVGGLPQESPAAEKPSSRWIFGSAVMTIEMSSTIISSWRG